MSKTNKKAQGGDYEIGRGKTPHHTRWSKGTSGNPGGKKKGTLNLQSTFQEALLRPITVTVEGEKKVISVFEGLVMRLLDSALNGNRRWKRAKRIARSWSVSLARFQRPHPRPSNQPQRGGSEWKE